MFHQLLASAELNKKNLRKQQAQRMREAKRMKRMEVRTLEQSSEDIGLQETHPVEPKSSGDGNARCEQDDCQDGGSMELVQESELERKGHEHGVMVVRFLLQLCNRLRVVLGRGRSPSASKQRKCAEQNSQGRWH